MSCDCSTLSSCDDCPTPPRGEENPDYGRRFRVEIPPVDHTFAKITLENIQRRTYDVMKGLA